MERETGVVQGIDRDRVAGWQGDKVVRVKGKVKAKDRAGNKSDEVKLIVESVEEIKTENIENTLLKLQESQWGQYVQSGSENLVKLKMHKKLLPALNQWMVQNGIQIISIIPRNSLEDLFLKVTSGKNYWEHI